LTIGVVMRSVHKFGCGHKFGRAASASIVVRGAEAGDCCGFTGAGFVGLEDCATYDVNANQVFAWRKRYRNEAGAPAALQLMPGDGDAGTPDRACEPAPVAAAELIEIELVGGCRVRVGNGVKASALRLVLDVLDRR
jgi:hypothetical protein